MIFKQKMKNLENEVSKKYDYLMGIVATLILQH